MVFSSVTFLFFFLPLFLLCYALLPFRNTIALLFSILFYSWGEGVFILILLLSVVINYVAGNRVDSESDQGRRARWLGLGLAANLILLFYFKYFGFFIYDVIGLDEFNPEYVPHLPLGISFFTFQSISYLIDVYRRKAMPARSIWDLALYIMMFPQLIAGPIVRYYWVARQIKRRTLHFNYVRHGMLFFSIGMAQKVLIANNVAIIADDIFALSNESLSTLLAWVGALAYTLQIYFDFSGYSNMAIGLGLCMGFKFPQNFNYPYISLSVTEFWRRWHISLSSWFRDYLYIPLGGNRQGTLRTYLNLFAVFVLCGLWHGASWTFLWWGLYHGFLLVVERLGLTRLLAALPVVIRHSYALTAIVIGWVLFRAETIEQALNFLGQMSGLTTTNPLAPHLREFAGNQQLFFMVVGIVAATPVLRKGLTTIISDRQIEVYRRSPNPEFLRNFADMVFVMFLLSVCAIYTAADTYNPFIYFRF